MKSEQLGAILRLLLSLIFYPVVIVIMLWLIFTNQHWIWGVLVLVAVVVLDPIYRIIFKSVVKWRPQNQTKK